MISNTNYIIYDSLISQGESEGEIDLDTLEILCEVQEVSHGVGQPSNNLVKRYQNELKWFLVAHSGKPFDSIGWKTKFESFYIF